MPLKPTSRREQLLLLTAAFHRPTDVSIGECFSVCALVPATSKYSVCWINST